MTASASNPPDPLPFGANSTDNAEPGSDSAGAQILATRERHQWWLRRLRPEVVVKFEPNRSFFLSTFSNGHTRRDLIPGNRASQRWERCPHGNASRRRSLRRRGRLPWFLRLVNLFVRAEGDRRRVQGHRLPRLPRRRDRRSDLPWPVRRCAARDLARRGIRHRELRRAATSSRSQSRVGGRPAS